MSIPSPSNTRLVMLLIRCEAYQLAVNTIRESYLGSKARVEHATPLKVAVMELTGISRMYHALVEEISAPDPRTKDLPLMKSVIPVSAIVTVYLSFCLKWGPKFMETRKPFELKNTLIVYNAVNVVISIWMAYEALVSGWWNDYSFKCQLNDYSDNPKAMRMARMAYTYFLCKLVELLDTVFFVLRKKSTQVTFLHLYHHGAMPFLTYITVKLSPGGSPTFGMLLNCIVHSVMYSYYLLAGLGPRYQKYLWWKSHLTKLQLIQFLMIIVQLLPLLLPDCKFPKAIPIIHLTNLCAIFYLFLSFYKRSYGKPDGKTDTRVDKLE